MEMEKLRNSVYLMGNAGTDLIVVNFSEGRKMARVSLAVNEFYKNSAGEAISHTQWFNLVFWGKTVAMAEALVKKGKMLCVAGRLNTQSYIDKKGNQRFTTEIFVNNLQEDE